MIADNGQFAVTMVDSVQIGPDSWREKSTTRIFPVGATMRQILDWSKATGGTADFAHLMFSEVVE